MRTLISLTLVFFFCFIPLTSAQNIPAKLKKIMEQNSAMHDSYESQPYIAWGVALTKTGKTLHWYSFINSDMYYQFMFSEKLSAEDSLAISKLLDGLNRSYESSDNWVGASNDWAMSEYSPTTCYKKYTGTWYTDYEGKKQREYYEIGSLCAATTKYVKIMRKVFTKFEVSAVNQVIVNEEYAWALKK